MSEENNSPGADISGPISSLSLSGLRMKPEIPEEIIARWQKTVDLLAKVCGVPAAGITRILSEDLEILVTSCTEGNPFEQGSRFHRDGKLLCERAMARRRPLLIPDLRKDPDYSPAIDSEPPIISYFGIPLEWTDGEIFGTICLFDGKVHEYSQVYQDLMRQSKELIEGHLRLLVELEERKCGERSLCRIQESLERQIAERTHTLTQLNRELLDARIEMEQHVAVRTAELAKTNESLRTEIAEKKRIEATLLEYQKAVEGSQDLICVVDQDYVYRLVNDTLLQYRNMTREEIIGHRVEEVLGRDLFEKSVKPELDRCFQGETVEFETRYRYPDLGSQSLHIRFYPVLTAEGKATRVVAVLRDMTEQKRAEEERMMLEEHLRNSVHDGIVTVDSRGKVLAINSAAGSLLGTLPANAVGKSLHDLCRGGREAISELVESSTRSGEFIREYQITGTTADRSWTYIIGVTPLKGLTEERAVLVIRDISRLRALEQEVSGRFAFENIIGKSQAMVRIFDMVRHLADTDSTVLIQGPSGTGKELVAEALHYHGARRKGPLVKVNCAALPETLLETELFGHVRGAFTGATQQKLGRFEMANGGTIFLDEIGDMSPRIQLRLLRVLQERAIERVGSGRTIKIDVRVVAATNKNLSELVMQGLFRDDLYYRLNVFTLRLPALRDRREDVPLLIRHFMLRFEERFGRTIKAIDPQVMDLFLHHEWPGNVRQLENALEHAVVLCRDGIIHLDNLPQELFRGSAMRAVTPVETRQPMDSHRLREVLDSVGWNRSRAASLIGVHRNTLARWMRKHGLGNFLR
ncbi:MAG TPA: sigma 54-interacting transcriptional regulator [bacterium]|nr:sigma 54-interacting transcriptional regulator [bacterium]HQL61602.1 sigma 54-interacting transcriptional regulator [bacterium]